MRRVLLIDDNYEFSELLELSLSREYDITKCHSLKDIQNLQSQDYYDLILTDYNLGLHSGFEITDLLRKNTGTKSSKILLISGSIDLERISEELEVDDYLEKPFKIKELKIKMQALLS